MKQAFDISRVFAADLSMNCLNCASDQVRRHVFGFFARFAAIYEQAVGFKHR